MGLILAIGILFATIIKHTYSNPNHVDCHVNPSTGICQINCADCDGIDLFCKPNYPCNVNCWDEGCAESRIYCSNTPSCTVDCTSNQCEKLEIYATFTATFICLGNCDIIRLDTLTPTLIPTNIPTKSPSHIPTIYPSVLPTYKPTFIPTIIPTVSPIISYVYKLTNEPTTNPIDVVLDENETNYYTENDRNMSPDLIYILIVFGVIFYYICWFALMLNCYIRRKRNKTLFANIEHHRVTSITMNNSGSVESSDLHNMAMDKSSKFEQELRNIMVIDELIMNEIVDHMDTNNADFVICNDANSDESIQMTVEGYEHENVNDGNVQYNTNQIGIDEFVIDGDSVLGSGRYIGSGKIGE
eukprot:72308_1